MGNLEKLDSTLLGLPNDERARLAKLLLLSLEETSDEDVEDAWKTEAERRYLEYQTGKVQLVEGRDAIKDARPKLR